MLWLRWNVKLINHSKLVHHELLDMSADEVVLLLDAVNQQSIERYGDLLLNC